jgi:hypothetical protein
MTFTNRQRLLLSLAGAVAGSVACFALTLFAEQASFSWFLRNCNHLVGTPVERVVPWVVFSLYIPSLSASLVYISAKAKRKQSMLQPPSKRRVDPSLSIIR